MGVDLQNMVTQEGLPYAPPIPPKNATPYPSSVLPQQKIADSVKRR